VVCLKGIAADEARFSRSRRERALLSALARLERSNTLGADRVLVPSHYSAGVSAETYGIAKDRIAVVPEAVDLAPWRAVRAAREAKRADSAPTDTPNGLDATRRLTILSVARQYPRKDTATLLRAMPAVLARHANTRLHVIGGGPELGRLRALSRELNLGEAVTLHGEVAEDAAVRAAFLDADVFCLPSLQEGFGIAFVEAMAAGLPVVAARAGAVPEVVEDGLTGLLVAQRDPPAVAAALIRLLHEPDARLRMGEEGTRRAERFDLVPVAEQFIAEVRPGELAAAT
jgi:glycosyltransferase involved in cell wall biosynthesis